MGMRFHKSIRLLPFLYLNFSKSGISFSLGHPGAALNLGSKGARGSVGLPGTGLSYRKTLFGGNSGAWRGIWWLITVAALLALAGYALFALRNLF